MQLTSSLRWFGYWGIVVASIWSTSHILGGRCCNRFSCCQKTVLGSVFGVLLPYTAYLIQTQFLLSVDVVDSYLYWSGRLMGVSREWL